MEGDAFPGLIPISNSVLNCHAAALEVAVSHRGIEVERCILNVLIESHVVRAFVNVMCGAAPNLRNERPDEVREQIYERIDGMTDRVTHGQRWQQRQDQIRPGRDALPGGDSSSRHGRSAARSSSASPVPDRSPRAGIGCHAWREQHHSRAKCGRRASSILCLQNAGVAEARTGWRNYGRALRSDLRHQRQRTVVHRAEGSTSDSRRPIDHLERSMVASKGVRAHVDDGFEGTLTRSVRVRSTLRL